MNTPSKTTFQHLVQIPVIVAALGYLVDMYDLFLFSVVRIPSLKALQIPDELLLSKGVFILNMQLAGLLIGGLIWGILGDKKGRLSVLFGSIILYSIANIANGFVTTYDQYALLRFVAGIGLAGELGAGITLVAEILPKELRGYGAAVVATMGVLGAILANFVTELFDWRAAYLVGGGMGILLLLLRFRVFESSLFKNITQRPIQRGNVLMLFNNRSRFIRFFSTILMGVPLWFVVGVLITFSPEFGKEKGLLDPIVAGKAVTFAFTGQIFGDMVSAFLSQYLQSRKKAMFIFILLSFSFMLIYLLVPIPNATIFYLLCGCLGFCNGYWTLFITIAAELFGTNLRATVATGVPNFVRGSTIPLTTLFVALKPSFGVSNSALIIAIGIVAISLLSLTLLHETFHRDMDYLEE